MKTAFDLVKDRLTLIDFPANQYFQQETPKKSICLHHTAGGSGISSINGWKANTEKVATCVVIDRDGSILQCFSSKYWAYSLGLNTANYKQIEQQTIAIELANYGWLNKIKDKYYTAYGSQIDPAHIYDHQTKYRGYRYYEKYTFAQIESVKRLLLYWNKIYNIDLTYHENMWRLNKEALSGAPGIWTHASYRADKSDCCPQTPLVDMLKNLK
jgi:N-acetyl-anhydromuramyl-L-alanine amidase AmpD